MARSFLLPSNFSDWIKSQLIERLEKRQNRIDKPDSVESASGNEIAVVAEGFGYEVRVTTRGNDFNECINR